MTFFAVEDQREDLDYDPEHEAWVEAVCSEGPPGPGCVICNSEAPLCTDCQEEHDYDKETRMHPSTLTPLLPCDLCSNTATVVYLIGTAGAKGLRLMGDRVWTARCGSHPSKAAGEDDVLTVGVTTVVRGGGRKISDSIRVFEISFGPHGTDHEPDWNNVRGTCSKCGMGRIDVIPSD